MKKLILVATTLFSVNVGADQACVALLKEYASQLREMASDQDAMSSKLNEAGDKTQWLCEFDRNTLQAFHYNYSGRLGRHVDNLRRITDAMEKLNCQ